MVVVIAVLGCAEGALRVSTAVWDVSIEGFADRGLGSLPGGEESVLVKGVRACRDAAWAGYDILRSGVICTEAVELTSNWIEPIPFSKPSPPWSWSSRGRYAGLLMGGSQFTRSCSYERVFLVDGDRNPRTIRAGSPVAGSVWEARVVRVEGIGGG
jgi:hypothetical protein